MVGHAFASSCRRTRSPKNPTAKSAKHKTKTAVEWQAQLNTPSHDANEDADALLLSVVGAASSELRRYVFIFSSFASVTKAAHALAKPENRLADSWAQSCFQNRRVEMRKPEHDPISPDVELGVTVILSLAPALLKTLPIRDPYNGPAKMWFAA